MRRKPATDQQPIQRSGHRRLLVGVFVNSSEVYGRAILRGVTRYANLQRRWLLFKDLEKALTVESSWPELDGAVFGGIPLPLVERGFAHSRHHVHCSGGGEPELGPVVAIDDVAVGRLAAEHLMDCRLEQFAFYSHAPGFRASDNRLKGFRAALEQRGYSCVVCPLDTPTPQQRLVHSNRPAVLKWLRALPKPIGIMAFDDTNAHDIAEACLEANISVPDHVAVIGVNNDDLVCESCWPPLSSVDADYTRLGYTAARILDRLFVGEVLSREEHLTVLPPIGVVQRQSTSTLAIADVNLAEAVRFIREHACDPCSMQDVLREVPVGRRWLERQFVAQLGRTPHEEITRVRIDAAKRLLVRSDLDVLEISSKCGFAEVKSFYLAFRKVTQTTPAHFRRNASAKSDVPPPPSQKRRN